MESELNPEVIFSLGHVQVTPFGVHRVDQRLKIGGLLHYMG
jgi:hypothetical protein